jgi:hypothetical protein
MKRFVPRLTYANVVATLALFIALGGASYAAMKLPKNSVGTKQLKNNSITAAKIKNGAVAGAKVNAATLGTVPTALRAASSDSAVHSASAASATHADISDLATNANALGGQPATAFMPSSKFFSGIASTTAPTPQVLIAIPNGPDLTTPGGGGSFSLEISFPATGGGTEAWTVAAPSSEAPVGPGGSDSFAISGTLNANVTLTNAAGTRSLTAVCTDLVTSSKITCSGVLFG